MNVNAIARRYLFDFPIGKPRINIGAENLCLRLYTAAETAAFWLAGMSAAEKNQ
jgi:hypothetical protein